MRFISRTLIAASAALLAGVTLTIPAHATELDCGDAPAVFPYSASGADLFSDAEEAVAAIASPDARLTQAGGCVIGEPVQPYGIEGTPVVLKVKTNAGELWVRDSHVAAYVPVAADDLTSFAVVLERPPGTPLGALIAGSRDAFLHPGNPVTGTPREVELKVGQVLATDPEQLVQGVNKFEQSLWQPILDPVDGRVLWGDAQILAALPSTDDARHEVTAGEGWMLYTDPTNDTASRTVEPGETFTATAPQNGWRYAGEDGWLKQPDREVSTDDESSEPSLWDKTKDKSTELWGSAKDKSSELLEKATDKKDAVVAKPVSIWETPAAIGAGVLALAGIILSMIPVTRPRGLKSMSPKAWILAGVGLVAAPAGLALSVAAVSVVPASWAWLFWTVLGLSVVSGMMLGRYAGKLAPSGSMPATVADLKRAALHPARIAAGVTMVGLAGALPMLALDAPALVLVPALIAGASVYSALVLKNGPAAADADTTTDTTEPIEEPNHA